MTTNADNLARYYSEDDVIALESFCVANKLDMEESAAEIIREGMTPLSWVVMRIQG